MAGALGIDFGTEYTRLVEATEAGHLERVDSPQQQQNKTPSAIGFREVWLWGWSAAAYPEMVVWDLKELACEKCLSRVAVYAAGGREYAAGDIISEFFRRMRQEMADRQPHVASLPTALCVPYAFGMRHRHLMRMAAEDAGFPLVGLINEPEAAVFGYGLHEAVTECNRQTVLVFDTGALRSSVCLLEIAKIDPGFTIELLASRQAPGFREFIRHFLPGEKADPQADIKLATMSTTLVAALSEAVDESRDVTVETGEADVTISADEARSELEKWKVQIDRALDDVFEVAELHPRDVDVALPVGGGCSIQQVRQVLMHLPHVAEPPRGATHEGITARGTARYASFLADDDTEPPFISPEIPPVGFKLADGTFHPVLEANHAVGAEAFRVYTSPDGQTLAFQPMEGFARRAASNWALSKEEITVQLEDPDDPVRAHMKRIDDFEVQLTIDGTIEPLKLQLELN
ncbi:MAG: Hsp70 family protein [Armatimonadota bacterium]